MVQPCGYCIQASLQASLSSLYVRTDCSAFGSYISDVPRHLRMLTYGLRSIASVCRSMSSRCATSSISETFWSGTTALPLPALPNARWSLGWLLLALAAVPEGVPLLAMKGDAGALRARTDERSDEEAVDEEEESEVFEVDADAEGSVGSA